MMLAIVLIAFFFVIQGESASKRAAYDNNCPLVSMTHLDPYECRLVYKCSSAGSVKRSSDVLSVQAYYCPKPTCVKKVQGKCGWEVCACEDHRGISQLGKGVFKYWPEYNPGINYSCYCDKNPEILAICGAKCEEIEGPVRVTPKAPRPLPTFPPPPTGWNGNWKK